MVRISVGVHGEESPPRVSVHAASIRAAEELARGCFPGAAVRVVFPIDGESFFSGGAEDIEYDLAETIAG